MFEGRIRWWGTDDIHQDFEEPNHPAHTTAMPGRPVVQSAARGLRQLRRPCNAQGVQWRLRGLQCRREVQISATPTSESPDLTGDALINSIAASTDPAGMLCSQCYGNKLTHI
jgi:hypothetical protein